jgi:hypothetical protein
MSVADYSAGPISPAKLRAAGITGVVRYVTGGSSGKHITRTEYQDLRAAGLDVALVYEADERILAYPNWDAATAAHAVAADTRSLGFAGVVYWAVDYDILARDWPTVAGHLRTIDGIMTLARTGLYGSTDAIDWAYRDRVAARFWQCMSTGFSGGRNARRNSHTHLWQRRRSTVDGNAVDLNDVLSPQWATPAKPRRRHPIITAIEGEDMPIYLIRHVAHPEVFAIFGSGLARHIGPAEAAAYRAKQVPELASSNDLEYERLLMYTRALQA